MVFECFFDQLLFDFCIMVGRIDEQCFYVVVVEQYEVDWVIGFVDGQIEWCVGQECDDFGFD